VAAKTAVKASSNAAERDFVIARVFDAPRELVWKAFTDPERMKHWWGQKGFTVIASKMDLRPGGIYHYGMKAPDGSAMWGKFVFREVAAPERMVFINSFSDEAGGISRHPMAPTWPLEMLSTFTFEEEPGGKTKLTIRWASHNATADEQKTVVLSGVITGRLIRADAPLRNAACGLLAGRASSDGRAFW